MVLRALPVLEPKRPVDVAARTCGDVEGTDFSAFFVRDGVIRGAVALGRPADVRTARSLVGQRATVDTARLADADVPLAETLLS